MAGFTLFVVVGGDDVVYIGRSDDDAVEKRRELREKKRAVLSGRNGERAIGEERRQLGKGRGIQWRAMRGLLCEVEVVQSLADSRPSTPPASPRATCEKPAENPHSRFFS